jgi:hypothetical protein
VSATTVQLLRAASEIVGGNKALAERLGVGETLLALFLGDVRELPDRLLLRAVDIILADRQGPVPLSNQPAANSPPNSPHRAARGA